MVQEQKHNCVAFCMDQRLCQYCEMSKVLAHRMCNNEGTIPKHPPRDESLNVGTWVGSLPAEHKEFLLLLL